MFLHNNGASTLFDYSNYLHLISSTQYNLEVKLINNCLRIKTTFENKSCMKNLIFILTLNVEIRFISQNFEEKKPICDEKTSKANEIPYILTKLYY